jgi:hypothetical protein
VGTWTVLVLLVPLIIIAAGSVFVVALARRSKRQLAANLEVPPGMPAGAPREWAGSHTPEAKMHRRLLGMARTLAAVPLGDAAAIERRVDVERRIQELDGRLIALAAAPDEARRAAVSALEPEVATADNEVAALAVGPAPDGAG